MYRIVLGTGIPPKPARAEGVRTGKRTRLHGRAGAPRIVAQINVALGSPDLVAEARASMSAYYAFSDHGDGMVDGMLTTAAEIRTAVRRFADLGADEVMLYCYGSDAGQVDRLADLVA